MLLNVVCQWLNSFKLHILKLTDRADDKKPHIVVKSSSRWSNFNLVENNDLIFVMNGMNFADITQS